MRLIPPELSEEETRGETAERAVAPLAMEGVGEVGCRFEGGGFGETVAMLAARVGQGGWKGENRKCFQGGYHAVTLHHAMALFAHIPAHTLTQVCPLDPLLPR